MTSHRSRARRAARFTLAVAAVMIAGPILLALFLARLGAEPR